MYICVLHFYQYFNVLVDQNLFKLYDPDAGEIFGHNPCDGTFAQCLWSIGNLGIRHPFGLGQLAGNFNYQSSSGSFFHKLIFDFFTYVII